jgi:hypothetical protein
LKQATPLAGCCLHAPCRSFSIVAPCARALRAQKTPFLAPSRRCEEAAGVLYLLLRRTIHRRGDNKSAPRQHRRPLQCVAGAETAALRRDAFATLLTASSAHHTASTRLQLCSARSSLPSQVRRQLQIQAAVCVVEVHHIVAVLELCAVLSFDVCCQRSLCGSTGMRSSAYVR